MGYKKITAQDIELLKNFSGCIKMYGGIRATFKELDKIPNGYSDNIDRLYSEVISNIVNEWSYIQLYKKIPWWTFVPQSVISLIAIFISILK